LISQCENDRPSDLLMNLAVTYNVYNLEKKQNATDKLMKHCAFRFTYSKLQCNDKNLMNTQRLL